MQTVYSVLFNQPLFDIACLRAEIDADTEQRTRVGSERKSVTFVIDLLQCFFGRTVEFELHDVDETIGLQDQIYTAFRRMVFCFYIEAQQLKDNKKYILIMQFQVADQLVRCVGKETLQAA